MKYTHKSVHDEVYTQITVHDEVYTQITVHDEEYTVEPLYSGHHRGTTCWPL